MSSILGRSDGTGRLVLRFFGPRPLLPAREPRERCSCTLTTDGSSWKDCYANGSIRIQHGLPASRGDK